MNKKLFDQKFWKEYGDEIYTCESAQDSRKQEKWDERASSNRKGGKKEYIRSLRKDKRSKRSDVWG
jgi:hypothetical protein